MAEELNLDQAMDATMAEVAEKISEESPPGDGGEAAAPSSTEAKGSAQTATDASKDDAAKAAVLPADDFPASWKAELRDHWKAAPAELRAEAIRREQDFLKGIEQYKNGYGMSQRFQKTLEPYMETINRAAGGDPMVAITHLLNADATLRYGSNAQKIEMLQTLVKQFGVQLDPDAPEKPAYVQELEKKVGGLERTLTASQQRMYEEARSKLDQEVETFWKDPAHPYADELADDIVKLIGAGYNLQEAYGRAVWSNPVTREKELGRMQAQAKTDLAKKAEDEAAAALKARGTNVTGRDSARSPTETLGSWDDTMKETLREINSRT